MDEQALRALVRETIARHAGRPDSRGFGHHADDPSHAAAPPLDAMSHPSHGRFPLTRGDRQDDGACLIEPAVACNHCGYCQSWGH